MSSASSVDVVNGQAMDDEAWFAVRDAPEVDAATDVDTQELAVHVSVGSNGELSLRGEATIHHVGSLVEQLRRTESSKVTRVSINLSELTALDTAGAQALIAFKRSCRSPSVHSCPAAARRFLELTGLTCLLTDEER